MLVCASLGGGSVFVGIRSTRPVVPRATPPPSRRPVVVARGVLSPSDVHLYGLTFGQVLAFEVSRKMITMHLPLLAFYRYGFGFSWMFAAQMVLLVSGFACAVEELM